MRILYLTDTRAIGGAERCLADLAEGVASAGHDLLLVAPQDELVTWLAREAPRARAQPAFSDAYHDATSPSRRMSALLGMLPHMVRELRRLAPHVAHINNGGYPGSDLCRIAALAAWIARVPRRVMTVHSDPWARDHLADPRAQALADRIVWLSLSAVVSTSDAVAEGLRARRGMPSRLNHTIYSGVRQARPDPSAVARLRERFAPRGELVVGMVSSQPSPQKGYEVFVEALTKTRSGARGVLVGEPPEDLARCVRTTELGQRLTMEGPQRKVDDYYGAFDVLIVPSTAYESLTLVTLEAASAGTPTFGSRLSGIPEAIADGVSGRLFEPGAAHELAALIDAAADDRRWIEAMGHEARLRWQQHFDLDATVRAMLELYGSI